MEKKKEPRILGAREMSLVYRLSRPDSFFATAEEKQIIDRFAAEGIVKVYPGEMSSEIEVTNLGAECWYETLKAQNRVNFTAKGDVLMAHETGGQGVNTAGK